MTRTKQIIEATLLFGIATFANSQTAPVVTQTASQSPCANIVALSGAKVDCSHLTPAQAKALENIPAILKTALENQTYLEEILQRLGAISGSAPSLVCSDNASCVVSTGQTGGITAGTVQVDTPPLKLTATLAEAEKWPGMPPSLAKFDHFSILTVTPNVQWQPVAFRFTCDQELKQVQLDMTSFDNDTSLINPGNPKVGYVYRAEPVGAGMPIPVRIFSDVALTKCDTVPVVVTFR
jgi:hypothetical protein